MYAHPGKKLLFMGGEIGQWREWNHDWQLDWEVLGDARHAGLQRWVRDLNRTYQQEPALWDADNEPRGFQWIDADDAERGVIAFMRSGNPKGLPPQHGEELPPRHDTQTGDTQTGGGNPLGLPAHLIAPAQLIAIVNFTPVPRRDYRIGVPEPGGYVELLNSDAEVYGGSNMGNEGRVETEAVASHGHPHSIRLTVPPLGFLLLKPNN
jgi:1,4-alpha-glucan branching enzyme